MQVSKTARETVKKKKKKVLYPSLHLFLNAEKKNQMHNL